MLLGQPKIVITLNQGPSLTDRQTENQHEQLQHPPPHPTPQVAPQPQQQERTQIASQRELRSPSTTQTSPHLLQQWRTAPSIQDLTESQTPYVQFDQAARRRSLTAASLTPLHRPSQINSLQPKIDIDWNIPTTAEDLTIFASLSESPKKQFRLRVEQTESNNSPKIKPTSHSSVRSEPTAVASNRNKGRKWSLTSTKSMGEATGSEEKRNSEASAEKTSGKVTDTTENDREKSVTVASAASESTIHDSSAHSASHSDAIVVRAIESNFRLDIARNKSILLLHDAEILQKNSEMRKTLMEEVDRINQRLGTAKSDEERECYRSYLNELQAELDKWNRSANFGKDSLGVSSSGHDEKEKIIISKKAPVNAIPKTDSLGSDKFTERSSCDKTHRDHGSIQIRQSSEEKQRQIQNDDFPSDVRKQWRVAKVIAPNTLPEGFKFEARIDDEVFLATVPQGGVKKGEIFSTRMGDIYGDNEDAAERTRVFKDMDAPPSRWRDELFDCFRHGLDHPFLCNTIFCPMIALHQILSRLQMDGTGIPLVTIKSRTRVCSVVWISLLVVLVHIVYVAYFAVATPGDETAIIIATMPLVGLDLLLLVYMACMVAKTRKRIRREYDIPELRCKGYEDCCMAVFCACCTIAQMGRHTADYETYRAYCCSDTGLASHIEIKLPVDACMGQGNHQKKSMQL